MSPGGVEPPGSPAGKERPAPVLGWRARLEAAQRGVMRQRFVLAGTDVMRAYDRAGGGMLAGGLSYFGFFTVVPALLLFVSLLGVLIEAPEQREQLVNSLIEQLDPIRDVAVAVVDGLADSARTGTIIGILGLLWGGSGFYGALQGSMQRLFPGPGSRDFFQTRLRGLLAIVVILGAMLVAVIVIVVVPLVTEWLQTRCIRMTVIDGDLANWLCRFDTSQVNSTISLVGAVVVAFAAAFFVYVAIPPDGPTWRQALLPALLAGLAIGLLTQLFGLVAPFLVRHWLTLGIVGSVFISLVWFNLVFQALLYGAAFARLRRDRDRTLAGPPTI